MFSLLFYSNDFFKCLICGIYFPNKTKFIAYIANINYVSLFPVIQFTILEAFENYTVSIRINLTSGETQNKPRVYFWGLLGVCFLFNLPLWVLLYLTIQENNPPTLTTSGTYMILKMIQDCHQIYNVHFRVMIVKTGQ